MKARTGRLVRIEIEGRVDSQLEGGPDERAHRDRAEELMRLRPDDARPRVPADAGLAGRFAGARRR